MSIVRADTLEEVEVIPTGLFIDKLTGVGGIPRSVITEIYGDEGIGKSSLCFQIVARAQAQGLRCLWADVEWSYSAQYAKFLGVDNSKVGVIREQIAENLLNTIQEELEKENWDLIVLDSIGGLHPRAEAEKDADGKVVGGQARLVASFCRKVVPLLSLHNTALIVINHAVQDLMSPKVYTSGGKKLAYHKALSIRLKPKYGKNLLVQGDRKVGKIVVGEVMKNKLAGTERLEIEGQLIFGSGFSVAADLLSDAIEKQVIVKKGNTYWFGEEKLGIGLSRVRKMMEEDAVLVEKIKVAMNEEGRKNT